MKKEDYQSVNDSIPIDIVFIPEALFIEFTDKLKVQVAFYRSIILINLDTKVCKTNPTKFLKSQTINNKVKLEPQRLQFCTTINYDKFTKNFENKIVFYYLFQINVQVAYQADGNK